MARFRYLAFTSDGLRENGSLEATSESQAWEKLATLGLTAVEIVEDSGARRGLSRQSLFSRKVPIAAQAELAEQLAVLFSARLSVVQVVDIVAKGAGAPAIRRQFQRVSSLMADGVSFHGALSQAASGLSPLFVALAQTADKSADPAPQMKSLAVILRRQEKMSSQLVGALVYPFILVLGGGGVLAVMALYLAPRLAAIFTSINRPAPTELTVFIAVGDFLQQWWLPAVLLFALAATSSPFLLERFRPAIRRASFRVPIWGSLARDSALSSTSRALQLMLESRLPLALALCDTAAAMPDNPFSELFLRAGRALENGGTARDVFRAEPALPPLFSDLFAIGEQSNTLPTVMASVADALEERVERKAQQAVALVTPLLTLIIGGAVALLVYSIMSALLSVNDLAL